MGGTGRPLGKTFFLHCQRRHPELPKIPTYLSVRLPPSRCHVLVFGGFNFLSAPGSVCGRAVVSVGGGGSVRFCPRRYRCLRLGVGVGWGRCLLACVVWCGGLGGRLVRGGVLCCGVLWWRLFFPHYGGATRRGRVRPSVSFPWVSTRGTRASSFSIRPGGAYARIKHPRRTHSGWPR